MLWMKELYSLMKAGLPYRYRQLRARLFDKLEDGFDPKQIDHRLANGGRLTPLGILYIDPKNKILPVCDRIIQAIRNEIISDPDTTTFNTDFITQKIGITEECASFCFSIISSLGRFWSYSTGSGSQITTIGIDQDDVFDEYLNYKGMEDLLNKTFSEKLYRSDQLETSRHLDKESTRSSVFQSQIAQVDIKLCFVLMPFGEPWSNRVYADLIRKVVESLGLQCLRADNLTGRIVIEDIWTKINQSAFLIADVTGRNPNVMYEIGIAHAIGKPTILITQEISKIPFDFNHLRHHAYQDNIDGFREMELRLPSVIRQIYDEIYQLDLNDLLSDGYLRGGVT